MFDREVVGPYGAFVQAVVHAETGRVLAAAVEPADLVQETWLRAFRSIGDFRGGEPAEMRAWLKRIAVRVVLDAARRARARRGGRPDVPIARPAGSIEGESPAVDPVDPGPTPSRALRRGERLERLERAMAGLRDDHREVIRLVRLEGLPVGEAARLLGRSPNATSMLLLRALLALRERFAPTESLHLPPREVDRGAVGPGAEAEDEPPVSGDPGEPDGETSEEARP